ncbi:unnamed protein product [Echinostoma caproni]|uniref:Uncharacterized protein n=1 Tax=Echinostoma caproni TaxID=27848 RepID=A0A3P8I3C1_9TREM|nr:unnamed protein product [Echinostoma caproni]
MLHPNPATSDGRGVINRAANRTNIQLDRSADEIEPESGQP